MNYKLWRKLRRVHRELWTWMGEDPFRQKVDWPKWDSLDKDVIGAWENNRCAACYWDDLHGGDCRGCPLVWPKGFGCSCYDPNSLFARLMTMQTIASSGVRSQEHLAAYRRLCQQMADAWPREPKVAFKI